MWAQVIGFILLFFALGLQPLLHLLKDLSRTPIDPALGQLPSLSEAELSAFYEKRRTLVIGGTRGVGRGVARAIVKAGGDVTIVGRNATSGASAVEFLKANANKTSQQIKFLAGDLGSERTAKALVRELEGVAKKEGSFDYLVVTAAVFPDWNELKQEDGLEKGHAIAVVGRYIVYRHMNLFLKEGGRVLNVLASGEKKSAFDRTLLTGERNVTGLWEAVLNWAGCAEVMQIGLQNSGNFHKTTRVSTHPGIISTELHVGQGWVMDFLEPIMVGLAGISEEECGLRQANILASGKLPKGNLSYVDEDMKGRLRSEQLQENANTHLGWLMTWLDARSNL